MHPLVGARTGPLMAAAAPDAVIVHDIPLLVENGLATAYHLVVVVDAPVEVRVRRLVTARGMAEDDARARIRAQASDEQRRAVADVWLDNGGPETPCSGRRRAVGRPARAVRGEPPAAQAAPAVSAEDRRVRPHLAAQAERVLARVRAAAGELALRADHIGSTSCWPARQGRPRPAAHGVHFGRRGHIAGLLSDAGFPRLEGDCVDDAQDGTGTWPKRLHVGADPKRPVNLHVRSQETPAWRLALLFRDYVRAHPDERDDYRDVKLRLAEAHAADGTVEAYADEKQDWVNAAFVRAGKWAETTGWTP